MARLRQPSRLLSSESPEIINRNWAFIRYLVKLEVVRRQSGKTINVPLAMTVMNRERYLVSMLGENTNWVRNVRAAEGKARLRHEVCEQILLKEVDINQRAPILKAFLGHAPGARPHIPVSKDVQSRNLKK